MSTDSLVRKISSRLYYLACYHFFFWFLTLRGHIKEKLAFHQVSFNSVRLLFSVFAGPQLVAFSRPAHFPECQLSLSVSQIVWSHVVTGELIRLARNAWCFTVLALRGTMLQGHSGKMRAHVCNTREILLAQRNGNEYFFCKTMAALLKFPSLVFILRG